MHVLGPNIQIEPDSRSIEKPARNALESGLEVVQPRPYSPNPVPSISNDD